MTAAVGQLFFDRHARGHVAHGIVAVDPVHPVGLELLRTQERGQFV